MKQNVYDNPTFFKGYMDLRSDESGFNVAIEEPAVHSLLPPLEGSYILDIGCGFGKFASFCLKQGAAHVSGIDISQKMISEAKNRIKTPKVSFSVTPVEDFETAEGAFDLVVSSMCFHYVKDIKSVFEKVAIALKKDGHFIFSIEHPICTALLKGWYSSDGVSQKHWPVDNYRKETIRESNWFIDGVIKYHRTIETYVNTLIDAGFLLKRILEPGPTVTAIAEKPELSEHLRRPPILVIAATKK